MVELVIKADGSKELYRRDKLILSVIRCGVPEEDALKLVDEVEAALPNVAPSDEIYTQVLTRLRKRFPHCAIRYAVRRAIMRMGPEGYPFEKFVAKLLERMGYSTRTNVKMKGKCVEHELDVVAERKGIRIFAECKYHNAPGLRVDAKVALYVYARYLDLKEHFDEVWIVTNTKVTREAAAYAECVGMRVLAWHYPEEGLEALIENYNLHPITVLSTLSEEHRRALLRRGIVTLDDLAKLSVSELAEVAGLSMEQAQAALAEAKVIERLQR